MYVICCRLCDVVSKLEMSHDVAEMCPTWRESSTLFECLVPLNTPCLAHSLLTALPELLHTDSACMWKAEGWEGGGAMVWLGEPFGQVCSALLYRGEGRGGRRDGTTGGTAERMRWEKPCGRCEILYGWSSSKRRRGECEVEMRGGDESFSGHVGVSVVQMLVSSVCTDSLGLSWISNWWGTRQLYTTIQMMQTLRFFFYSDWIMTNSQGKVEVFSILFVFLFVGEIVTKKGWMGEHAWGGVKWGTAYFCIIRLCEHVTTCSATTNLLLAISNVIYNMVAKYLWLS